MIILFRQTIISLAKKEFIVKHLFIAFLSFALFSSAFAQQSNIEQPVYLRFPSVPSFTVYKAPDSTAFTRDNLKKKKPVMFFIFSPECSHCKHETEMMIQHMEKLRNVEILMITYLPYNEMMDFYKNYKLDRFSNITVARDTKFFFPTYFNVRNFPSFYIYDKKGNFKKFLEGDVKIDTLMEALKS